MAAASRSDDGVDGLRDAVEILVLGAGPTGLGAASRLLMVSHDLGLQNELAGCG